MMKSRKQKTSIKAAVGIQEATERARQEMFARVQSWHIGSISFSETPRILDGATSVRKLDALASRSWLASWIAATAARCAPRCESPIEVMMLGELVFIATPPTCDLSPMPMVSIDCQKQIGPYRVDFLVSTETTNGKLINLIVEVDGHEFHEKTKQQAQRDKERDRYLVSAGFTVMRFTGSEVYKDAEKCVCEVSSFIENLLCEEDESNG